MSFYVRATIIYFLCYLYVRLWICRLLADNAGIRRGVLAATDVLTIALPVTIFFQSDLPYIVKIVLQGAGYSWAAIIACMVPVGLCFEPIRWGIRILGNGLRVPRMKIFAVLCLVSAVVVIGGYINAASPVVREMSFDLSDGNSKAREYRVAVFADLHAGKLMTRDRVGSVVNLVNTLNPDIVLMAGDIIDDHDAEFTGAADELARLKAPLGKYAVLGNHEYYLGSAWARNMLEKQGVRVLNDETAVVDGRFLLAGRNDFAAPMRNGRRKELGAVLPKNNTLPIILLDHTPRNLEEAEKAGVRLQISGHTHNGQLFPFNLIVKKLYEKEYGFYKRGATDYYITCGVGFWGPPLRTSSRPEVLLMKIKI
ncbi:metallophosphoesterase [Maridesulfovibrio sp.]|uniref:metallophosphoesterase n=1 Tax=Maridesulfovibrio sp. TaxID=2795000 RepID=UPI002A189156|nr:metallophosphoesterase [Maridesulfovibrio sp.]